MGRGRVRVRVKDSTLEQAPHTWPMKEGALMMTALRKETG